MVREWLVFFADGERFAWWDIWTRPGFRHVLAAGYDVEAERWVIFDPRATGTTILLLHQDAAGGKLAELIEASAGRVLRFAPRSRRRCQPFVGGCVGAVASLLGIRGALSPSGLHRQLLAMGAMPAFEDSHGLHEAEIPRSRAGGSPAAAGANPAAAGH
ncbi:hypothetical protein [Azospirillum rugosum]|uniref:Uncharacterized protein n=1 Tax=Azospirillum rugosum TaxID=416170 RepID=A0ABS4SDS5_9PROT|nr:hypothetical protein [Azospirillum rugosum]MBP2290728.1 hypothetical protein [Azospirillum rugosum]MDQ0525617.1 hypothetical protein [Azospirillum rugosum]